MPSQEPDSGQRIEMAQEWTDCAAHLFGLSARMHADADTIKRRAEYALSKAKELTSGV